MSAYYNEIDPYAAQWLRNLIDAGHIAPGIVDERSIVDVKTKDLTGFTQCHFFAGIGGWSLALRLAGWSDNHPVWTGSPPCQPFSTAGKQLGQADDRHLAPHWLELVSQCHPSTLFGEQVAAAIGKGWFDDLQIYLENEGYACGLVVLPACSVGAPHLRQRQWIVAERLADTERDGGRPDESRRETQGGIADRGNSATNELAHAPGERRGEGRHTVGGSKERESGHGTAGRMGDTSTTGLSICERKTLEGSGRREKRGATMQPSGTSISMVDSESERQHRDESTAGQDGLPVTETGSEDYRPGPTNGFWRAADWLFCRDGNWRSVEPGTFPLAYGVPARVGKLRAYGNAIVPQIAAEVIKGVMQ